MFSVFLMLYILSKKFTLVLRGLIFVMRQERTPFSRGHVTGGCMRRLYHDHIIISTFLQDCATSGCHSGCRCWRRLNGWFHIFIRRADKTSRASGNRSDVKIDHGTLLFSIVGGYKVEERLVFFWRLHLLTTADQPNHIGWLVLLITIFGPEAFDLRI